MPKQRPISVGELIDQSWEIYRSRLVEFLGVSGWLLVTAILYTISLAFYPAASTLALGGSLSGTELFGVYLYAATSFILAPLLTFWIYTSLVRMARAHLIRKRPDHVTALKEGKVAFVPAAITTVMVVLMLLLAMVVGFGPPAILAGIGIWLNVGSLVVVGNVLLVLGLFVSLYLSIQWVVYYFFAPIATINDGKSGKVALDISRKLVLGRFWGVFGRIIVPKLVFISFGVFGMSVIAYASNLIIEASTGLNIDLQLRITTMFETIIPILIVVLINPLFVISDVVLYKSLKDTK